MTYGMYQEKEKKQIEEQIDLLLNLLNNHDNEISRIELEQKCIDEIIKIRENYTIDYGLLFKCIHFLEYLGVISEDKEIKSNCINAIIKISKNSEFDRGFFYRTLFVYIHAIQHIYEKSNSKEDAKKIIDGIIEILTNETINQYILYECINTLQYIYEKYKNDDDIGKQCMLSNKKIEIEYIKGYECIDEYMLDMYYYTLDDILKDSKNLKIEETYINETIKISEKSNKEGILDGCIRVLEKICINFEDYNTKNICIDRIMWILKNKENIQNIQHYCIGIFKNVYEKCKDSKDSKDSEIKEKCINGIKEILEKYIEKLNDKTPKNKNYNSCILLECDYCIKVLEYFAVDSKIEDIQKCIKAIIEISQKENIDEDNLSSCIYFLKKICDEYENSKIKEECIRGIIEISQKENIDEDNLSSCIYLLGKIYNSGNSEIKKLCSNGIIEILQKENIDEDNLSSCIYLLGKIYNSGNSEIKKICSDGIIEISTKKNIDEDKLYSLCTNGINEILQSNKYTNSKGSSPKSLFNLNGNNQYNNNVDKQSEIWQGKAKKNNNEQKAKENGRGL